jgi:hypothetical protein
VPPRLRRHGPDVSRFLEYPARFDAIGVFFSVQKQSNQRNESLLRWHEHRSVGVDVRVLTIKCKTDGVKFPDKKLITLHYALGDHRVGDFDKAGNVGAHHKVGGLTVLGCRA